MKYLFKTLEPIESGNMKLMAEIRCDGETLFVKIYTLTGGGAHARGTVSYNGTSEEFIVSAERSDTISFQYNSTVNTVRINHSGVSHNCTWQDDIHDPAPSVDITYTGARVNSYLDMSFDYSSASAYNAHVCTTIYQKNSYGNWEMIRNYAIKNSSNSHSHLFDSWWSAETVIKIVLTFACYRTSSAVINDFIGLAEYSLPEFTITQEGTPLAPCRLHYEPSYSGHPITVSWEAVNDPKFDIDGYVVWRVLNDGSISEVYRGTATEFDDVTPVNAETVAYRVSSISGELCSTSTDGDAVRLIRSNVYIGMNSVPKRAKAIYMGRNGTVVPASTFAYAMQTKSRS